MTTPWKTWMRERLPSTTRTCTLTESPGRNPGMSSRNESASSASRVFISAVLSLRWLVLGADSGTPRLSGPGELRLPCGSARRRRRRSAAALYCATSSGEHARRPRAGPSDQRRKQLGELRRDERLVGGGDLLDAPPSVRLVLVRLELRLPAHIDLVNDA